MLYALLIYERDGDFDRRGDEEEVSYTGAWQAWHKSLLEAGVFVGGNPLERPDTGTTIRQRDSKRMVQDGPYADTKEQLGGFTLLELPSLDAALEWAARCPAASYGAVEVRPVAGQMHKRITGEEPYARR
ncbi:MAG TPA: YciI family protein [Steroidobacteraceae bacterium]|nr:YciI family protein [Steroidobacteraceae bacterium]